MSFERQHIGTVKVSSGKIVVVDPEVVRDELGFQSARAINNDENAGQVFEGIAIGTEYADAEFQVFISRSDDRKRITIELEEIE